MSVSGVGTTGYPIAGYETRKAGRNVVGSGFDNQMNNTIKSKNSSGGIVLNISNDTDGKAICSSGSHNGSVTVYKPNDFDPANPVYKVKAWDADGNVTERMVDISKVDPNNCDYIDMIAYSSHLTDSGQCPNAQRAFMGAEMNYGSANISTYGNLFDKVNWTDIIQGMMKMQFNAGNITGYLGYKQFYDFLSR